MLRSWTGVLMVLLVVLTGGCSAGGDRADRQIIDPSGAELAAHREAARKRLAEIERPLRAASAGTRIVGTREHVSCVTGNEGPKGPVDPWDSECDIQHSLAISTSDPVKALLAIDAALVAMGYRGSWFESDRRTPVDPADVRRGKVPGSRVTSAGYGGGGPGVVLQLGRTGERQLFLRRSLRVGYYNSNEGADWDSAVAFGNQIEQPLIAVELSLPAFFRKPDTA